VVVERDVESLLAWVRGALAEPGEHGARRLFAILDGARDEQIVPMIRAAGVEARCLFDGELAPALAAAAPYLVALDPAAAFTRGLLARGWGEAWGVLLVASAGLEPLRRHFRQFLRVRDEDGRHLLFRYYDPRVLRLYLPTCTSEELAQVFGPVAAFLLEDSDGGAQLRRAGGGLEVQLRVGA